MNNEQKRQQENAAASKAMDAINEARRAESLAPETLDALEAAASALIADMALNRAAATPAPSQVNPKPAAGRPPASTKEEER